MFHVQFHPFLCRAQGTLGYRRRAFGLKDSELWNDPKVAKRVINHGENAGKIEESSGSHQKPVKDWEFNNQTLGFDHVEKPIKLVGC